MTDDNNEDGRGPVTYRSVSQVKQYQSCPYQYYLERRKKVWQRPAAWFPQGTAVHAVVEDYEKSDRSMTLEQAQYRFSEAYSVAVSRYTDETSNLRHWYWSGPYNGERDLERRHGLGIEQVGRYLRFAEKNPKPDVLGDQLAVELPFKVKFGEVEVRGFIDQVVKGEPIDVKTGNKPGDDFQLGTYAGALDQQYGIKPKTGAFWMGRTGKLTIPYDLSEWTQQRLADVYGEVDALILAEEFDPRPEASKCKFCNVSTSCEFALS